MAELNFDASTVPPNEALEAIPANWYNMMIDHSEMKPTKSGTGAYLELGLKVLDGPYAGRRVYHRLNLKNDNKQAQEIAYRELSSYCHATGVIQVRESFELHGIPVMVKVGIETDPSGKYEPSNSVKQVKPVEGGAIGRESFNAAPAPAPSNPTQTTAPKPPWA